MWQDTAVCVTVALCTIIVCAAVVVSAN